MSIYNLNADNAITITSVGNNSLLTAKNAGTKLNIDKISLVYESRAEGLANNNTGYVGPAPASVVAIYTTEISVESINDHLLRIRLIIPDVAAHAHVGSVTFYTGSTVFGYFSYPQPWNKIVDTVPSSLEWIVERDFILSHINSVDSELPSVASAAFLLPADINLPNTMFVIRNDNYNNINYINSAWNIVYIKNGVWTPGLIPLMNPPDISNATSIISSYYSDDKSPFGSPATVGADPRSAYGAQVRATFGLPLALSKGFLYNDGESVKTRELPAGTSTVKGIIRLATEDEVGGGIRDDVAVTPRDLKKLSGISQSQAYLTKAEMELADIPASIPRTALFIGKTWVDAVRVNANPEHELSVLVKNQWWELRPQLVMTDMASTPDAAALAAYKMDLPMLLIGQTANIYPAFREGKAEGKYNYTLLHKVVKWREKCFISANGVLGIVQTGTGARYMTIHDVDGDGRAAVDWGRSAHGLLSLSHNVSPMTSGNYLTINSVTFGTRGESHHPVMRTVSQYPCTIGLTSPLPTFLIVGSCVAARSVVGNNDAAAASGAHIIEWISSDRLSFRCTVNCGRTVDLVSPTTITNGTVWNSILESTLLIPQVTWIWDTEYSAVKTKAVTAISDNTNGPSSANTLNLTCAAHGIPNASIIVMQGVSPQLDGRRLRVYAVPDANTLAVVDLNTSAFSSVGMTFTAGGTVTEYTEIFTGSAQEAFLNSRFGQINLAYMGLSYEGWLHAATGTSMDQDAIFLEDLGGTCELLACVIAGAGDKCLRGFSHSNFVINHSWVGGGGAQSALYIQGSYARAVRSGFNGTFRETVLGSMASGIILNSVIVNSSVTSLVTVSDSSFCACYPAKLAAGFRALYSTGGEINIMTSTLIDGCSIAIDSMSGGIVSNRPTVTNCATYTNTPENDMGKGASRFIADIGLMQKTPEVVTKLTFGSGTYIDGDIQSSSEAAGAVTINEGWGNITTSSLSIASGDFYEITVTNSLATTTGNIQLSRIGGSNVTGHLYFYVKSRAVGSFVIRIENWHPSVTATGTLILSFAYTV